MHMTKDDSLFAYVRADLRADGRLKSCKLAMTMLKTVLEPKPQKL